MKVKELIKELSKYNGDSDGYYCGEDGHYIYDMSVTPSWCPLEDEHE